MTRKAVHLIPYDGIGGVERAAATADGAQANGAVLERMFIFENVRGHKSRIQTFNPLAFWRAAGRLKKKNPDLVILSLWRSVIVGGLAWVRGCRAPRVLFLHNSEDAHRIDRWVTRTAARLAHCVWADSTATLNARLPLRPKRTRVISFLTEHRAPVRLPEPDPEPRFVFWGRLAEQKDPLRMLAFFKSVHARIPDARLDIFGPDGGLESLLRRRIADEGLSAAVTLHGPAEPETLAAHARYASFYLQTSRYEGMALAVIEAMQYGLVPVVTPVGEIAHYSAPNENAVWLTRAGKDDDAAIDQVIALLADPERWRELRSKAISQWSAIPIYRDDLMAAVCAALNRN